MNSKREQSRSYLIDLAKVLICLRGATIQETARAIGVSESSIRDFLARTRLSLSPEHAVKFYYHLGIGKNITGETGLLSQCVHHYRLDYSAGGDATAMVETLRPLLPGAVATMLPLTDNRTQAVLIKTATARVVLLIKSKGLLRRQPLNLNLLNLSDCEVAYPADASTIPPEYKVSIFTGQIGLVDFDALFDASFPDWNTLRRVANSHNISYAEIIHFMKERSRTSRGLTHREYRGLEMIPGGNKNRTAYRPHQRYDAEQKMAGGEGKS